MSQPTTEQTSRGAAILDRADFNSFLDALTKHGYEIIGPTVRDSAIVFGDVRRDTDLPIGVTDEHEGGHYRLKPTGSQALFAYAVGPHSLKNYLYPSRSLLYRVRGSSSDFTVDVPNAERVPRRAYIGVRACELRAMAIQDKVFAEGDYADPGYAARRAGLFIVAVNCGSPAGNCFCSSMGSGPKAEAHFDVALTEVCDDTRHYFVVEYGSAQGKALFDDVPHRGASENERDAAIDVVRGAEARMGKTMDTSGIRDLLYRNAQSPRWEETAKRCLACANCTMVCPTCFCSTVEDTTSLSGDNAERWRVWDSCFTIDFSHIHGGSVRKSGSSRYRQWITHKLASWHDQFDTSGCVGCGRCITWCPVGIDITEEVSALRTAEAGGRAATGG
ncbi:MAG: 4Fe-4S dicluster domain-containing protein [Candidatus Hydrogenedentes bacterium]|nr:4Fe-4S dicluster domain-containing protein [Candidatus Hydrogenedentota bacterium]